MKEMTKIFFDKGILKPKFANLDSYGLITYMEQYEFTNAEWIQIVLSQIHVGFFWVGEIPVKIMNDLIHVVTGLSNEGLILKIEKDTKC